MQLKKITGTFRQHRNIALVVSLVTVDAIFFSSTNPAKVSAAWLMVGVLLVAASLYLLCNGLLAIGKLYGIELGHHRRRFALVISAVCAGLCALQSINQLSRHDILVIVPLAIIGYLYFSYGKASQT